MTTTWILVANAAAAKLYANDGPRKGLRKIREFEHPASREKGSRLVSDRPGHNQGHGNGHGSYIPLHEPKEVQAEHFAMELCKQLDHGRTTNAYQRLILVSAPAFLGLMNGHLSHHVKQLVSDSFEKDYTKLDDKALAVHLESCIFL
ncbi:MAG: host attachment protein [Burkholderiales bacterium]